MTQAVFGFDVGTASSKAVLVSLDGRLLRQGVREHRVDRPAPGFVEMDATVWWEEFVSLAEELTGAADIEVVSVGVSGMGPCALVTDERDAPLRPAILYGVDTRATAEIALLDARLGADTILARCGSRLTSQAVGPKLLWIQQHEPEVWARVRRIFMPSSWLVARLTGEYVMDHHSASQCTPMYDPVNGAWIADWSALVAPGTSLPDLRWPGDEAGRTRTAVGGIAVGTPVVAGTIDAWTEAVSVGATQPGDLMLMYGSTMFLIATVTEDLRHPSMWGTVGVAPGTRNLAGGLATSGAITSWISELTGADFVALTEDARDAGVGAHGLLLLPYFAGERTPIQDPDARGVIAGLTLGHTRGDLYRAALEGTALAVRHNIRVMEEAGAVIERVVAVGGGTQGGLWTQIVSDATGRSQVVPEITVGASFGAAILAVGLVAGADGPVDVDAWNPKATTVRPDPATTARYDELFALYLDLYENTVDVVHTLVGSTNDPTTHEGTSS